jgi:hypothetical protein
MNDIVEKWKKFEKEYSRAIWVNNSESYQDSLEQHLEQEVDLSDEWLLIIPEKNELRSYDPVNDQEERYDLLSRSEEEDLGFVENSRMLEEVYKPEFMTLSDSQITELEKIISRENLQGEVSDSSKLIEVMENSGIGYEKPEVLNKTYTDGGCFTEERGLSIDIMPEKVTLKYSEDYTGEIPDLSSINGLEKV